jgi:AcrR family transcriptional regulator
VTAPELPVGDDPLGEMPEVARKIVDAAMRLLGRVGLKGLTLTAVAAEADVYADSIRYYFGGMRGLLETVVFSLSHESSLRAMKSLGAIGDSSTRAHEIAEIGKTIAVEPDYTIYWEVLPRILRDEKWRHRLAAEYEWYRELYLRDFPEHPAAFRPVPDTKRARQLASVMVAVIDGFALQKAVDPDNIDLDEAFQYWSAVIAPTLAATLALESTRDT